MLPHDPMTPRPPFPVPDEPGTGGDALMGRLVRRDPGALLELYELVGGELLSEVRQHLTDPGDCETVLHATMLEVWRLARFHVSTGSNVRGWSCAIATRRAIERRHAYVVTLAHPCDDVNRVEVAEIFAAAR